MSLIREVTVGMPFDPKGWNVGHLANLGLLLSCDGFSIRLDLDNLNLLFDAAEDDKHVNLKDHDGNQVSVVPTDNGIILIPKDNLDFPNGLLLDIEALKEMGIEKYEEEVDDDLDELGDEEDIDEIDPEEVLDELESDDKIEEGIKRAFKRSGKKIKRGYRVTSGFRRGRIVMSPKGAYKPRKSAATRMKMKVASRRKRVVRVLKGKRTRRKSVSKRLVRMNKRIK
jgi:hypothetical protein